MPARIVTPPAAIDFDAIRAELAVPADYPADAVREACLAEGLLVLTCGPGENVLRLIPPLNVSDDDLRLGLDILERALQACA